MRILHVCSSKYKNCGIGFFSCNFNSIIKERVRGSNVTFSNKAEHGKYDALIVHHEYSIFSKKIIKGLSEIECNNRILFAHSPIQNPGSYAIRHFDKFISMKDDMVNTAAPKLVDVCPGYMPKRKLPGFREKLGVRGKIVIGNFSMASSQRKLYEIVYQIINNTSNILIYLNCPPNTFDQRNTKEILGLVESIGSDRIIIDKSFKNADARYAAMRECDLLWCFSSIENGNYSSASVSDMYVSGSHLVVNSCKQHSHVEELPNCTSFETFDPVLFGKALSVKDFQIEQPVDLSWKNSFKDLGDFIIA